MDVEANALSPLEHVEARAMAEAVCELNSERERLLNRMAAVQTSLCQSRARLSALLARVEAINSPEFVSR
jgi:hypothetical protein